MYRDDREALLHQAESATREAERLKRENEAMRVAVALQPAHAISTLTLPAGAAYSSLDIRALPMEERARLAMHTVRQFPVWLVGVLNVLTFGLFPMIHFGLLHDKLPRASHNDPSSGRAIGFQFIPYYNLYWIFFSALRLSDRLSLQLRLRGLPHRAPRGMLVAACVVTVIPYLNIIVAFPILWTIAVCMLQSTVNRVASLSPTAWDATVVDGKPLMTSAAAAYPMVPTSPEQVAHQQKAQRLVTWSHLLGWGGLGLLVVGSPIIGISAGGPAAGGFAGLCAIGVIVGAIIGQVGRGMQGRAI